MTPDRHPIVPPLARSGRLNLSREELVAWGEAFGRAVRAPLVVALRGELGAGKTTLAQAICRGLGVTDEVTSPTYAIAQAYVGRNGPVYHLDLYRLNDERDLTNVGWDDILDAGGVVLVEWPDRAGDRLPPDHVPIDLEYVDGDESRRLLLAG